MTSIKGPATADDAAGNQMEYFSGRLLPYRIGSACALDGKEWVSFGKIIGVMNPEADDGRQVPAGQGRGNYRCQPRVGPAMALALGEAGAKLALVGRDKTRLAETPEAGEKQRRR